jgi:hypothetical protein
MNHVILAPNTAQRFKVPAGFFYNVAQLSKPSEGLYKTVKQRRDVYIHPGSGAPCACVRASSSVMLGPRMDALVSCQRALSVASLPCSATSTEHDDRIAQMCTCTTCITPLQMSTNPARTQRCPSL